ncbi:hypothetical protein ACH4NI_35480 [Streptomyces olivaceus]|uniref:DUF6197 family protein n=1 Tax=Streptomyces olivaceus TaxID=47716 RepID=UPI00379BA1DB
MTTPTPADIADVLDRAADHINRVGWIQDEWWEGTPPDLYPEAVSVDADSALAVAAGAEPFAPDSGLTTEQAFVYHAAADALRRHVGCGLILWNDKPGRTQAEVTAVMRAAAASQREQVAS